MICRGSNNYGPRQYPEKLIPLCVLNALHGDPLPVYGDGRQVRNWLYVEDFAAASTRCSSAGGPARPTTWAARTSARTSTWCRRILELTGARRVADRVRDATAPATTAATRSRSDKLRAELGWEAQMRFDEGLARTVDWYRDNEGWWGPIRSGEYREYYERHYGRSLSQP